MNKNIIASLTFFLVLVVLLWLTPIQKVKIIGDFFEKIIKPLSIPISTVLGIRLGIIKYKKIKNKDEL